MTDPNDAAFSIPGIEGQPAVPGLTKREYFAAMAMQGFAASTTLNEGTRSAECAVKWADALIAELNKNEKA